jgi:DNA polymerase II large subunit
VSLEELGLLRDWLCEAKREDGKIVARKGSAKRVLELIGAPHRLVSNEYVVIEKECAEALTHCLALDKGVGGEASAAILSSKDSLDAVNKLSGLAVADKSGTFIGSRMGRPEKAKMRSLKGNAARIIPCRRAGRPP